MDLDTASAFLLGSIGYGMGMLLWLVVVIIANNLLSTYWKPVQFFKFDSMPAARFATEEELKQEPK
jgi:hypothetical protein